MISEDSIDDKGSKADALASILDSLKEVEIALQTVRAKELIGDLDELESISFRNGIDFRNVVKRYQINLISLVLDKTEGNQTEAAKLLNLRLSTLSAMIKRYKLRPKRNSSGGFG